MPDSCVQHVHNLRTVPGLVTGLIHRILGINFSCVQTTRFVHCHRVVARKLSAGMQRPFTSVSLMFYTSSTGLTINTTNI